MKYQTYRFNADFQSDKYGVEAVCTGDTYFCRQVKFQVGLAYQPRIKVAFENELINNSRFREDFFGGWVVLLKIKSEEVIKCRTN